MIDYIATHTPEPWVAVPVAAGSPEWGVLRQGEKAFVLIGAEKADAIRTAACVNACKSWETSALEAFAADPAHPASLPSLLTAETRRAIAVTAERDAAVADARELRAACELALDYYHLSAGEWLKKHGAGMTTRDLGDVFRAALAAKYGQEAEQ